MNIIEIFVSGAIINFFEIIMCYKLCSEKVSYNKYNIYFACFVQTFLLTLNYIYVDNIVKVMVTFSIMILTCKLLFKNKSFVECALISFIIEIFMIVSEFIYIIVISLTSSMNNKTLMAAIEGKFITNIIISIIFVVLFSTNIPKKIYDFIIRHINNISKIIIFIVVGLIILIISLIFYISYYNENNYFTLFVNLFILIVYIVIATNLIIKENKYKEIRNNYSKTINELSEYESIINEYRIINHENKNQLNSIKGMTTSRKIHEYIDEILNNKNKRNTFILNQALVIPAGGLRGLIYSKMLLMTKYNINYKIHIDKKFNSKILRNISTKTIIDICQITGVYLDNAIEAVQNLKSKNILIDIYVDENINIIIKNNINSIIDENRIDKIGYSTKSNNHGYGLVLANKIISENNLLSNKREISSTSFKQQLIVKYK